MREHLKRVSTIASLAGLIFSIVCFFHAFSFTELTQAGLRSFTVGVFSLFCSFAMTMFFQQVELEKELTKHVQQAKDDAARAVQKIHDDIEKVAPIARLIESQPECAARLSDAAAQLHIAAQNPKHPQVPKHASHLVTELHKAAASLVQGKFTTQFWDCDILRHELERMDSYLLGYSPLFRKEEIKWWSSPTGREFLKANAHALKTKKCKIERIFCVPRDLSEVEGTLREHYDIGVDVYYLTANCVAPNIHRYDESAAVIDGKIAYYSATLPDDSKVNVWTVAESDVMKREHRLRSLFENVRKYVP